MEYTLFQCEHYSGDSFTITGKCSKVADHNGVSIKSCKNCRKQDKNKSLQNCVVSECDGKYSDYQGEQKLDIQIATSFPQFSNPIFKSAFISLKTFAARTDIDKDGWETQSTAFFFLSLEDWIGQRDDYCEAMKIQDKRNVLTFHPFEENSIVKIDEKTNKIENVIQQNDFFHCDEIPSHFSVCKIDAYNYLITGGVYFYNDQENKRQYTQSRETFNFHIHPEQKNFKFDCLRVNSRESDMDDLGFMKTQRIGHQMVYSYHKNLVYAIGGNDYDTYLQSIEIYNPDTKKWNNNGFSVPDMQTPRSRFASILFTTKDEKQQFIYVLGGYTNYHNEQTAEIVEKYDVLKNTWTTLKIKKKLGQQIPRAGGWGFQHVEKNDTNMYIIGGVDKNKNPMNQIFKIEEKNETIIFTEIGKLMIPRIKPTITITEIPGYQITQNSDGDITKVDKDFKQSNRFQIAVMGGGVGPKRSHIEYFYIEMGKIVDHKSECFQEYLPSGQMPEQYSCDTLIPINGYGCV